MLLCCFREPKEAKKRPSKGRGGGGGSERLFDDHEYNDPPAAELIGVKRTSYNNTSLSRPLKTTTGPVCDTPSSLSSNTAGGESEVLVASVTYHGQPQVAHNNSNSSSNNRYRHSVSSYTSGSLIAAGAPPGGPSSRPPSRDGSDRRDHKERAPISRETKRMLKQKSQESFKDNNKSVTSIPYIDASPPSSNGLGGLSCSKASFVSSPSHKGKCIFLVIALAQSAPKFEFREITTYSYYFTLYTIIRQNSPKEKRMSRSAIRQASKDEINVFRKKIKIEPVLRGLQL